MERALLQKIETNFSAYKEKLVETLQDYNYRYKRYNTEYSLALFTSTVPILKEFVYDMIRKTDTIVVFDEQFFAIVFDSVDETAGLKATENILINLEPSVFGKKIFVSVLNASEAEDAKGLVRKALDVLINEIKLGIDDIPMNH